MYDKSKWYNHIEEWILAFCFGLMTTIVGVNVVLRMLGNSIPWADQAARILFVWCTLIGISLAALTKQHLKVEALDAFLPKKYSFWVDLFGDFVSIIYAIIVCYFMWTYIQNMLLYPQYFSAMPWLSATVMYIPGLMGMIGFVVRLLQGSVIPNCKLIKGKKYLIEGYQAPAKESKEKTEEVNA